MATLSETANYVATITGIDNGDALDATELTTPETQLAKRTNYLHTHTPTVCDQTIRKIPLTSGIVSAVLNDWVFIDGLWINNESTVAYEIEFDLDLPVGVTVTGFTTTVQGRVSYISGTGAHGGSPANLPLFAFESRIPSAGASAAPVVIASASDPFTSVPVYDAVHTVTVSTSTLIVAGTKYIFRIVGEYGANAQNNSLGILDLTVAWTAPANV